MLQDSKEGKFQRRISKLHLIEIQRAEYDSVIEEGIKRLCNEREILKWR